MTKSRESFGTGSLRGMSALRSGLVDHRMARRHLINEYHRGRLGREEVCDAHPELMRAARGIGKQTETKCPICEVANVVLVTYLFGARLPAHGKVITENKELAEYRLRKKDGTTLWVEDHGWINKDETTGHIFHEV